MKFMVSAIDVRLLRSSGASIAASVLMILIVAEALTVGEATLSLVIVAAEVAVKINELMKSEAFVKERNLDWKKEIKMSGELLKIREHASD